MATTNRDAMIDRVFERLANAPDGLDCSVNQVLAGCGMLISAILREGYSNPAAEADRFCRALLLHINRSNGAIARRH